MCYEPKDGVFGGVQTALGEWKGIVGDVHNGKADLSVSLFAFTSERRHAFEPSHGIEMAE